MEYLEGGAEDETTLKRNRSIFERIAWLPRMLVGTGLPDLARDVLGDSLHLPLIIAPTGFNGSTVVTYNLSDPLPPARAEDEQR